ncbi:hypothetical protein ASPZODRAFT_16385 [Penicilliopsis zonata CBS 506.65]|uniref:Uncharacterized protein n=1 Tax=Penicilliopsis zonata CBS 506.65 TaxID=1073090 RepID=A0A1L9SH88_9EURO|nr:hypothetical protein ASPZODRAFT_16385 [Penicilliopsis zonata CBS 506.65]OJJ46630.1 hypothetical protein ASPZODRAFT_16385 [Penicilliopsis zonata CBS 506.65]
MAPDTNSVPPSPQPQPPSGMTSGRTSDAPSSPSSRGPSQTMATPMVSHGPTAHATATPIVVDHGNGGTGQGPLRHPKPLTAADLHLMLEKEQESMVNRLSRELSLLRQQTASVASTASSTSTTFNESLEPLHSPYINSSMHPTASRRHRSSSNLSSYIPAVQGSRAGGMAAGSRPATDLGRSCRSREPSITSPRPSENSLSPLLMQPTSQPYQGDYLAHITSNHHAPASSQRYLPPQQGFSGQQAGTMSRLEEIVHQRGELDAVKRENEALRRRVRELELTLKKHRELELAKTAEVSLAEASQA